MIINLLTVISNVLVFFRQQTSFSICFVTENNYVHYFKTAVALACIRSKPPGVSSREYAENLCAQYRAAGDRWKQKYEEAERTILRLKQTQELQSSLNFSGMF